MEKKFIGLLYAWNEKLNQNYVVVLNILQFYFENKSIYRRAHFIVSLNTSHPRDFENADNRFENEL